MSRTRGSTFGRCSRRRRLTGTVVVVMVGAVVASVLAGAAGAQEPGGFTDTGEHFAAGDIGALEAEGVFEGTGCVMQGGQALFCPAGPLERWVMAVWLVRILDGAEPASVDATRFSDVDAKAWWAPHVERLAELEVTVGYPDGTYRPGRSVTRAQMAAFLTRAFDLPEAPDAGFTDTAGNTHQDAINRLAAAGVTKGCGDGTRYCPDRETKRGEMAAFINRARGGAGEATTGTPTELASLAGPTVTVRSDAHDVWGGEFEVTLEFSEPVTGLTRDDLIVVNGRAMSLNGSDDRYVARIAVAAEGAVLIRVPRESAVDDDGRTNQASTPFVRIVTSSPRSEVPGLDNWDRDQVLKISQAEFDRQLPDADFTGDVSRCQAGTTSQTFRDSVFRRINYYRQMAGLNTVTEDPDFSRKAQAAALIMAAQADLSHYPPSDWACHTTTGAEAAASSNLGACWGACAGQAIAIGADGYMQDSDDNNRAVGHRRWVLHPPTRMMGTGDVANSAAQAYANVLWVFGDNRSGEWQVREERDFVAWPPSGYVPSNLVWSRWSFTIRDADFSNASVTMRDDNGSVSLEVTERITAINRLPASSIIWNVGGADDGSSALLPAPTDGDGCYYTTISGVVLNGRAQTPYEYAVCVLDPES